ncbi:DNA cytosine methyltransferase [Halobacillus sp. B29]|uniref:DNA cytosine methyltransferase n=1 Tax=Halobacillus sp. B29 TaxID=3457432 RepID=UPI003FCC7527
MIGGSPCQGFSNSNRKKGKNYLDDPNNKLVKEYIKSIKANENCQVFVLENVPQIFSAGEGQFRNEIYDALSDFEITSGILTAADDYGSAQLRRRAIFIGSKIGKIELPEPEVTPENYMSVREAFDGITDDIENQIDYSIPRQSTIDRMECIRPGENWKAIPEELKTSKMKEGSGPHSSVYRRLVMDEPSITITNVRKSNITHPILNRSLTIRECARLFGLPDSFAFKGSLDAMQQLIANSVPVDMARSIGNVVKKAITQFNIRNKDVALV